MNDIPLTVVMANRNGMPYLTESVASILQQTFTDYEFFVIDDHSSDDSLKYLKTINDKRLIVLQSFGKGIADALNTGLENVQSKYTAVMDSDDIADIARLEMQYKFMENHQDHVLVGTFIKYIGQSNNRLYWKVNLPKDDTKIKTGLILGYYVLSHPTIMFRTEAVQEIGGYDKSSEPVIDIEFYNRIANKGKFANLPHVVSSIRIHSESYTQRNLQPIIEQNYLVAKLGRESGFGFGQLMNKLKYQSARQYKLFLLNYLNSGSILTIYHLVLAGMLDLPRAYYYMRNKWYSNENLELRPDDSNSPDFWCESIFSSRKN